ncbi:MAG: Spy/CpxP family protein refolding chaperone [Xanthomonadales bacterium]|nr:Spy/CpxP family protein refolding chaperone [Xanthomonadales bacterium]
MQRNKLALIFGTALFCVSLAATAQPCFGPGGGGPRGVLGGLERIERMAGELQITDEQRDAIRAVVDGVRPQLREVFDGMRENREAIRETTFADSYDAAAVAQLAEVQGDLMAQTIVIRHQARADVMNLLTPEQRTQLAGMRASRCERRGTCFGR